MATGIVVVKQYERLVILKWGRLQVVAQPGFRFLIPIMYTGRLVDTREQVDRVPTQKYITRDNVVVDMDFVLYFKVTEEDAEKSVMNVDRKSTRLNSSHALISYAVFCLKKKKKKQKQYK